MATLSHNCPHCGVRHAAFPIVYSNKQLSSYDWNVFGICPACSYPITAVVYDRGTGQDPAKFLGNLSSENSYAVVLRVFPERQESKSPDSTPPSAAKSFVDGVEILKDGRYAAAVAMFRRAIDVGTKEFAPEIDVWKLEKRIDKLAADGLITKDLQTWAHKIRLEGNNAIHELEEPTKEQATELQLFTELMLTYLFTLPALIKKNLA